jgi:hypothetical protein
VAAEAAQAKVTFVFDYQFDTGNFFTQPARDELARAARVFEDRLVDNLASIGVSAGNTWDAEFTNPSTGAGQSVRNLNVAANTVRVYVGARPLGPVLALGGPGGSTVTGDAAYQNAVGLRGQSAGAAEPPSYDFGPWGGTVSFNSGAQWNFAAAGPAAGKNDFFTVAVHELAHVLGVGTAPSWRTRLTATTTPFGQVQYVGPFTGPKAAALHGSAVPLEAPPAQASAGDEVEHAAHAAPGLTSTVGGVTQDLMLDPDIAVGTRKRMTLLDWALLDDIGWDLAKPGDATANGAVDFNDLVQLAQNYDVTDGRRLWSQGDFTGDGNVNFNDLVLLAQNYDTTGVQAGEPVLLAGDDAFAAEWAEAQAAAAVPEPSITGAGVMAAIGALVRRRRRRGRFSGRILDS